MCDCKIIRGAKSKGISSPVSGIRAVLKAAMPQVHALAAAARSWELPEFVFKAVGSCFAYYCTKLGTP